MILGRLRVPGVMAGLWRDEDFKGILESKRKTVVVMKLFSFGFMGEGEVRDAIGL